MNEQVVAAFRSASEGYSPDRVIADPAFNARFLSECRRLGLTESDGALNRALMNLRKRGHLRGLKSKATTFPSQDNYRHAAEIAIRFLERRDALTLDQILCDPPRASEFDQVAARIVPGFTPVEYRWAALNLRKACQLRAEVASRLIQATSVESYRVVELNIALLSTGAGLYMFFTKAGPLYIGEAVNLQSRIRQHLDHSDNKGLARWLWQEGAEELHLEVHVLPPNVLTRARRALELEMIRSRQPLFNVKR